MNEETPMGEKGKKGEEGQALREAVAGIMKHVTADGVLIAGRENFEAYVESWIQAALAAAPAIPDPAREDTKLLDWLNEELVDTIYLDDGRIVDVKGGGVREAVSKAMGAITDPLDTPQRGDNHGDRIRTCAYCKGTNVCVHGYCRSGKCDDKCPHCLHGYCAVHDKSFYADSGCPHCEAARAVATQSIPAQVREKGGKEGDGERLREALEKLIANWREPRSLHPYRDEKKCADELERALATPETSPLPKMSDETFLQRATEENGCEISVGGSGKITGWNYVADKEVEPQEIRFDNGTVVRVVGDGCLEVTREPLVRPEKEPEGRVQPTHLCICEFWKSYNSDCPVHGTVAEPPKRRSQ